MSQSVAKRTPSMRKTVAKPGEVVTFSVVKPKLKPDSFTVKDLKRAIRKVAAAHAKA